MEFIIRKIKELAGTQEIQNNPLGEAYTVYFKNTPKDEKGKGIFEEIIDDYFSVTQPKDVVDKTNEVVAFVQGRNGYNTPIFIDDAVYIINQNGKTVERVYGHSAPRRQDW